MVESGVNSTFNREEILTFLAAVDEELTAKNRIILIGAAAAILAFENTRGSIDIDTYNKVDHLEKAIAKATKKMGLKIGFSQSTVAFGPVHFEKRLESYTDANFKYLDVWIPEAHDFVMMKITRLISRDLEDIVEIHNRQSLDADRLLHLYRTEMSYYVGNESQFEDKYLHTIETLFGSKVYKAQATKLKTKN